MISEVNARFYAYVYPDLRRTSLHCTVSDQRHFTYILIIPFRSDQERFVLS